MTDLPTYLLYTGPPTKRLNWDGAVMTGPKSSSRSGSPLPLVTQHLPANTGVSMRTVVNHMNGTKGKIASFTRGGGSRKQIIAWNDAPDDLYFYCTDQTK